MANITLKGNPTHTSGELPTIGKTAPAFNLTKTDLSELNSDNLKNKKIILNIFVSLDTDVCAQSTRKFNEAANKLKNTDILCVSMDLPFAAKRFCASENLKNVVPCSAFRHPEFAKNYGVLITDGPLQGLLARALVVIDESGQVVYTQLVTEITDEPNYDAALAKAG